MALERIQHCLACGYDLSGLPDEHLCPECGLRYQRHAHVFPRRRNLGYFFAPAPSLWQNVPQARIVYAFVAILRAGRWRGMLKGTPVAAIDLVAITLFDAGGQPMRIEFAAMGDCRVSWIDGAIRIQNGKGDALARVNPKDFGSRADANEFLKLLQQGMKRACGVSGPTSDS